MMLDDDLNHYIELYQTLGYKFRVQSTLLKSFVAFATKNGDKFIRAERVVTWAADAPSPAQRQNRLLTIRRFAVTMHAEDSRHEVPASQVFGHAVFERKAPYIYSQEDITRLIRAAKTMQPVGTIRPLMYATLFGLLAATGMRISEALALRLDDITSDGFIIRQTKFRKSRLIPIHYTTLQQINSYLSARTRLGACNDAFFISNTGMAPSYSTVIHTFLKLTRSIGLRGGPGTPGPRIHDLRHTFAIRSLEKCANNRIAVERHMISLSTYLGHAHVTDTYWYLQATPSLMEAIAQAGEALYQEDRA